MCRAGFYWLRVGGRGVFRSICVPAHQYSPMAIVRDGSGGGYLLRSRYLGISGPPSVPRIPAVLLCVLRRYGDSSGPPCLGPVGRVRGVPEGE